MNMRFFIKFAILLCLIFPKDSFAAPLTVDILSTQYTTFVSSRRVISEEPWTEATNSRTIVSSSPISDYMDVPDDDPSIGSVFGPGGRVAEAYPDFYEISVGSYHHGHDGNLAQASAQTKILFSPLVDDSAPIDFNFYGWYEWYYSGGYVSLFDITLNQELWNYSWDYGSPGTTVPWDHEFTGPMDPYATATLIPITDFSATHFYKLTMYAWVAANNDNERIQIHMSGLKPSSVPEPSTMLLLGTGLIGLAGWGRKKFKKT